MPTRTDKVALPRAGDRTAALPSLPFPLTLPLPLPLPFALAFQLPFPLAGLGLHHGWLPSSLFESGAPGGTTTCRTGSVEWAAPSAQAEPWVTWMSEAYESSRVVPDPDAES